MRTCMDSRVSAVDRAARTACIMMHAANSALYLSTLETCFNAQEQHQLPPQSLLSDDGGPSQAPVDAGLFVFHLYPRFLFITISFCSVCRLFCLASTARSICRKFVSGHGDRFRACAGAKVMADEILVFLSHLARYPIPSAYFLFRSQCYVLVKLQI